MYLSEKPRPIDLADREMMIEVVSNETLTPHPHHHHHHHHHPHHNQMILGDSSGGDEEPEPEHPEHPEPKAPKKRAETWIAEETRSLISFRREVDSLFNTSKSNKHLWEQISAKMREKGFDRSPTMCTDKWRNLLKEFKKARHQQDKGGGNSNSGNGKMSYYKELEELLRSRNRNSSSNCNTNNNNNNSNVGGGGYHQNSTQGHAKVDAFIQFSDKGFDDASIQFGPIEAGGRSTVNLERRLEHDGDPLAITAADTVAPNGVPPWNWRDTSANGEDPSNYGGKVISVKLGEYSRRIGIEGTADAIKEAIKSAFRLRTKRAFWLEDENNVVRSLDRDMPIGNYTLHLDEGITIKICLYDGSDRMPVQTEEKTLYTEDDFRDFLARRGYIGLREVDSYRSIDCLDDLHSGAMYAGVRLLGE